MGGGRQDPAINRAAFGYIGQGVSEAAAVEDHGIEVEGADTCVEGAGVGSINENVSRSGSGSVIDVDSGLESTARCHRHGLSGREGEPCVVEAVHPEA